MKTSHSRYWLGVCLCLLLTATFREVLAAESASNLEESVRLCLLQHGSPKQPRFWEQLAAVCRQSETVRNDIVQALLHILERGMQVERTTNGVLNDKRVLQDYDAGWKAAGTLGHLRSTEAIPLLMRATRRPDVYATVSIPAVIQIGDTNMLDFAKDVCTNRVTYSEEMAILFVFRGLADHVTPDNDLKKRTCAMQFLIENIPDRITANDWNATQAIDEALCKVDEEYSRSHEREAILEKFKEAPFYFPKEWKTLRELPSERRTHVDLKTLATKQHPVKPQTTNAAPTATRVP